MFNFLSKSVYFLFAITIKSNNIAAQIVAPHNRWRGGQIAPRQENLTEKLVALDKMGHLNDGLLAPPYITQHHSAVMGLRGSIAPPLPGDTPSPPRQLRLAVMFFQLAARAAAFHEPMAQLLRKNKKKLFLKTCHQYH